MLLLPEALSYIVAYLFYSDLCFYVITLSLIYL